MSRSSFRALAGSTALARASAVTDPTHATPVDSGQTTYADKIFVESPQPGTYKPPAHTCTALSASIKARLWAQVGV